MATLIDDVATPAVVVRTIDVTPENPGPTAPPAPNLNVPAIAAGVAVGLSISAILTTAPVTSGLAIDLSAKTPGPFDGTGTGKFSTWPDLSGNGNDAVVTAVAYGGQLPQVVYGETPNGSNAINMFGPTLSFTDQNVYSGATSGEIFIVVKPGSYFQGLYQFGGNDWTYYEWQDGNVYDGSFTASRYNFPGVPNASNSLNYFQVYNVSHDGTTRVARIDGTVVHTVTTPFVNPSSSPHSELLLGNITGNIWGGHIAEFMAYNRCLSIAERASVLTYLQNQFIATVPDPTPPDLLNVPAIGVGASVNGQPVDVLLPIGAVTVGVTVDAQPFDVGLPIGAVAVGVSVDGQPVDVELSVVPVAVGVTVDAQPPLVVDILDLSPVALGVTVGAAVTESSPPLALGARVTATAADASISLTAPLDGDVVEVHRPQFVVALDSAHQSAVWTVQVQYADNLGFTAATMLSATLTAVDGGVWLTPTADVPATTFWRARLLAADGTTEVGWTDAISFTVEDTPTPAQLNVVWQVDTSADRLVHLWSLNPAAAYPGDTVTCYGQGFPASGHVNVNGSPATVTRWEREPAVIDSITDQRHIIVGDVDCEHYEADFTVPASSGPGVIVEVL